MTHTTIVKHLSILTLVLVSFSCAQEAGNKKTPNDNQIQAVMIDVELKDSSSLFILLAKDGIINRKGDLKTKDKNFFMGISKDGLLEKLTTTISNDLSDYLDQVHVLADTNKAVNKIKIGFSGPNGDTGFHYYTDAPLDRFPKPILDLINNAMQVTDPWFRAQQEMTKPK